MGQKYFWFLVFAALFYIPGSQFGNILSCKQGMCTNYRSSGEENSQPTESPRRTTTPQTTEGPTPFTFFTNILQPTKHPQPVKASDSQSGNILGCRHGMYTNYELGEEKNPQLCEKYTTFSESIRTTTTHPTTKSPRTHGRRKPTTTLQITESPRPTTTPATTKSPRKPRQRRPTTESPPSSGKRTSELMCEKYFSASQNKIIGGSLTLIPQIINATNTECSVSTGLIYGGVDAINGEFPHMAAIGYLQNREIKYSCGGTLISDQHVLTAAHCQYSYNTQATIVRLGSVNIIKDFEGTQDILIEKFIKHEQYDPNNKANDIAILKLLNTANLNQMVRPACLYTGDVPIPNNTVIATGWGYMSNHNQAKILQKVELNIVDISWCNKVLDYELDGKIQICAGVLAGGKDTCQGDSGGPIQTVFEKKKCIFSVVGVTSFGNSWCAGQNSPAAYVKVSSYLDWIASKVWK